MVETAGKGGVQCPEGSVYILQGQKIPVSRILQDTVKLCCTLLNHVSILYKHVSLSTHWPFLLATRPTCQAGTN